MSGIIAVLNLDGAPVDPGLLRRMATAMAFLGPDGTSNWSAGAIGVGFAALVTHDATPQPASLDGRYWIVADARLDARAELCRKLEEDGRQPAGDAEILLRAYRRWGTQCLDHLRGDFSFILWDAAERKLLAGCDQIGVRQLFWTRVGATLVISNCFQALLAHPGLSREPDTRALADFLQHEVLLDEERTCLRDVSQLPAASALVAERGELRQWRYWHPPQPSPRARRDWEWVEGFRERLEEAVRDRVRSSPITVFLSGGLDSTSLAALAQQAGAKVHAVTCVHAPLLPDEEELRLAQLAADHLGIGLEVIRAAEFQLLQGLDMIAPTAMPSWGAMPAFQRAQVERAWQHGPVAWTGFDGDLVFGLPSATQEVLAQPDAFAAVDSAGKYLLYQGSMPLLRLARSRLVRRRVGGSQDPPVVIAREWQRPAPPSRPDTRSWPFATPLWTDMMRSFAPAAAPPLEFAHPLTDLRLVEFCLGLPPIPWRLQKRALREAMHPLLPREILARPKVPLAGDPIEARFQRGDLPAVRREELPPELAAVLDWEVVNLLQARRLPGGGAGLCRIFLAARWLASLRTAT